MVQTDHTLKALSDLDQPGKYIVRKGVPIFMEHVHPKTGDKVDRSVLEHMARVNNRRLQETGTPGSILIGHTTGRKEEELVHVGFHKNYRVGRFGPKKKLGLLCDQYFKPSLYSKAMQYPHRSIERWSDEVVDVVSLLARTPDLDLGLLLPDEGPIDKTIVASEGAELTCYSRGGKRRLYQMTEVPEMDIAMLLDGFQAVIDQARTKISGAVTPETYQAASSGTNAALPEMVQYSKESFQKLQIERDEAVRRADEATKNYQKQSRTQSLEALKNEGYMLDVEEEYTELADLDDAGFDKAVVRIKKCYQRGAPSANFISTQAPATDVETEYTRLRPLAMEYAQKNKCDMKTAFERVKAGKS